MTSDDILAAVCGSENVKTFKRVKLTSMAIAKVSKQIVAEDLGGSIPRKGKQFLRTERGVYRLALGSNSDNTTETKVHSEMGATVVQMFDPLSARRREVGIIDLADLYALHGRTFDGDDFLTKLDARLP